MQPLYQSRMMLVILFIGGLFYAFVANLHTDGPRMLERLSALPMPPRSLDEIRNIFDVVKRSGEEHYLGQHDAWAMHAQIQESIGKSTMNRLTVIKSPGGRLYRGGMFPITTDNAQMLAEVTATLERLADEKNVKLLYLAVPDPVAKGTTGDLPTNMPYLDYNVALDAFLYTLREKAVPSVDSRYELLTDDFAPSEISLKTGFMLTGEATFKIFNYLLDELKTRFSLVLDPDGYYRDISHYRVEKHEKFFIGQLGKETGPAFSGLDDFTAISPDFETALEISGLDLFGEDIQAEGTAEETLFQPDALLFYGDYYNLYPEAYSVHANSSWTRVVNRLNPDGPKILLVHDFFTAQFASLLAPMTGELHTLSYQENNKDMNVQDFLANADLDCIIVSLFPPNLLRQESQSLLLNEETLEELVISLTDSETE